MEASFIRIKVRPSNRWVVVLVGNWLPKMLNINRLLHDRGSCKLSFTFSLPCNVVQNSIVVYIRMLLKFKSDDVWIVINVTGQVWLVSTRYLCPLRLSHAMQLTSTVETKTSFEILTISFINIQHRVDTSRNKAWNVILRSISNSRITSDQHLSINLIQIQLLLNYGNIFEIGHVHQIAKFQLITVYLWL